MVSKRHVSGLFSERELNERERERTRDAHAVSAALLEYPRVTKHRRDRRPSLLVSFCKKVATRGDTLVGRRLSVPHILSDEASCYYHGYCLAEMSVHQTRAHFGGAAKIVDNKQVGAALTDAR